MDEKEIDLREYFKILKKRKWTIITLFILVTIGVTVKVFMMTPLYKATTKVIIVHPQILHQVLLHHLRLLPLRLQQLRQLLLQPVSGD